jgi:hypothetical protein
MYEIEELLFGTWGRRERKRELEKSTISKYIASVQVEDIIICIESCRIIGARRERGKEE